MEDEIFDFIDNIYYIISEYNYDYKVAKSDLVNLRKNILNKNFDKNAYFYQLMATIEYFIHISNFENTPYQILLPKEDYLYNTFKKSLELDSDNPPLQFLFALYLYMTGDFVNAKEQFSAIDQKYYENLNVIERILKIKEMILCCNIFLKQTSENEIIDFIRLINFNNDFSYPMDLIKTISNNKNYNTDNVKSELAELE